jgi:hypothetical protein
VPGGKGSTTCSVGGERWDWRRLAPLSCMRQWMIPVAAPRGMSGMLRYRTAESWTAMALLQSPSPRNRPGPPAAAGSTPIAPKASTQADRIPWYPQSERDSSVGRVPLLRGLEASRELRLFALWLRCTALCG